MFRVLCFCFGCVFRRLLKDFCLMQDHLPAADKGILVDSYRLAHETCCAHKPTLRVASEAFEGYCYPWQCFRCYHQHDDQQQSLTSKIN